MEFGIILSCEIGLVSTFHPRLSVYLPLPFLQPVGTTDYDVPKPHKTFFYDVDLFL